jgi:hypothetical protein
MSVNDISGLPILEVFSDDRVVMGTFGRNTLVVSGSTVTVSGSLLLSGSSNIAGGGSGTGFPFSGSAIITGSLLISGSPSTELTVVGDSIFTGSVVMSGSTQPELRVIGESVISGSLLVSGSGITTSGVLTNALASRTAWTAGSNITNPAAFPNSTDGNAATRWDTAAFQTAGQIYAVNFNETLTVNTFIMDTTGSPNDYPTLFDISSSLDGTNWTSIGTVAGATITTYNFSSPVTTRQLQFRIITPRGSNYWSVHEFNVSQSRGAGALTASGSVIFNGITDTTTTNKVLVLETSTGRVFTTSSVGGGGSGTGFPFSGSAVITGSLIISGSSPDNVGVLRINNTTPFGAGVHFPAARFLQSDGHSYGIVADFKTSGSGDRPAILFSADTPHSWQVGQGVYQANDNFSIGYRPSSDPNAFTNWATASIIITSGTLNVGLGTTAPVAKLQVQGNVSASSYTSSVSNAVGFLGTSSFAITASYALSAAGAGGSGTGFPFSGSARITGSLVVSGSSTSSILDVYKSGSTVFTVEGSQGQLFSVTDSLSGSLMSVNDITGLPILEVFSDDRVVMGTFGRNTLVVTGSRVGIDKATPTADLDVSGSVLVTGSFIATNMILPSTASILPQTGSMFYSSSFIYVYDGTRYRSASLI